MRLALAKLLPGSPTCSCRRADEPSRPEAQLARDVSRRVYPRGDPRLARSVLPRRGRHPHRRSHAAHAHRLPHQLQRYLLEHHERPALRGEARAGRRGRARQDTIDRFRYQATKASQVQSRSRCSRRSCRSRCRPSARRSTTTFPPARRAAGRDGAKHVRKVRDLAAFKDLNRTRAPIACARRAQRCRQVHAHGMPRARRRPTRPPRRRPQHRRAVFAQTRRRGWIRRRPSTRRWPRAAERHGARIRNILGGFLFGRRRLQAGEGAPAASARAHGGAHAVAPVEHAAAPSPPTTSTRLEGGALDALIDYGGTLISAAHDHLGRTARTKIIEVGSGEATSTRHLQGILALEHPQGREGQEGRDRQEGRWKGADGISEWQP